MTLMLDAARIGEVVVQFTTEPVSRTTLALYAGASGDHNPMHIDLDAARAAGLPDVFAHGMLGMAYLGRLLTQLAPPDRWRRFDTRFMAVTQLGDRLHCSAKLVAIDDSGLASLELTALDAAGQPKLKGAAQIAVR